MTNLLQASRTARRDDSLHSFGGNTYWGLPVSSTWRPNEESITSDFLGLVQGAYKSNGVIFACELTRMALFSEARFQWRQMGRGRPGDLFGTAELKILEQPWPGGTTGDLLSRMLVYADLGGISYVVRSNDERDRLRLPRPDWVTMVLGSQDEPQAANAAFDTDLLGIIYHPGGLNSGKGQDRVFLVDEFAYFAPIPDPLARFGGMSWLTPIVREVQADSAATMHKLMFFENGATPQLVVTMGPGVTPATLKQFVAKMDDQHAGWQNAYKTLYLGGGAQVNVVGKDLAQLDFKATQGAGETRIANASGMHAVVIGLSEGLAGSSLNAGNFTAGARLVANKTLRPLWRNAAGSLQNIVQAPPGANLWYDDRDIGFLKEDAKDAADIEFIKAQAIRQLVDAQFEPASIVAAIAAQDMTLLVHTGVPTVQGQQLATAAVAQLNGNAKSLVTP